MYNQKESICVYKCNKQFKGDFQTLTAGHAFEVVDRFNINYWILLEYMKTDRGKKKPMRKKQIKIIEIRYIERTL